VKELEKELSDHSSKTCEYKSFLEYCKKKNTINRLLFTHYKQKFYRKFKFNMYTNTQKSESKMIKNFAKKFGEPDKCIVTVGDFDKEHMKGKEPIICKRIRLLLKRYGYSVFLINEFKTSKLCNRCEHETENFLMRKPRNKKAKKQEERLVWGLVRCKNDKCKLIHNRDVNACKNMQKIVKSVFAINGRPKNYCRDE